MNPRFSLFVFFIFGSFIFLLNCGEVSEDNAANIFSDCSKSEMTCGSICIPTVSPNASSLHQEVVFRGCAGSNSCHTGANPKEGLDLTTETDFKAMINRASIQKNELSLVKPFEPEMSYLIHKLRGQNMSEKSSTGNSSKIMPRLAPALCDEVVEVFEEWIRNGAQ